MILFLIIVGLITIFILLFLYLFQRALKFHYERKWNRVWQYFIPTFLAVVMAFVGLKYVLPIYMDVADMARGQYKLEAHKISELKPWRFVDSNGEQFVYNPYENTIIQDENYMVYFSPRTHFAVSFQKIER